MVSMTETPARPSAAKDSSEHNPLGIRAGRDETLWIFDMGDHAGRTAAYGGGNGAQSGYHYSHSSGGNGGAQGGYHYSYHYSGSGSNNNSYHYSYVR